MLAPVPKSLPQDVTARGAAGSPQHPSGSLGKEENQFGPKAQFPQLVALCNGSVPSSVSGRHRSTHGSREAKPPPPPTLKVQRCFLCSCLHLSPPAPAELSTLLPGHDLSSCLCSLPPTPVLCSTPSLHCAVSDKCPQHRSTSQVSMLVRPSGHPPPTHHPLPAWSSCTGNTLRHFPLFPAPLMG